MVFAIDFDGTLCENKYPQIGAPKNDIINKCKQLHQQGHTLILWTCREGNDLKTAIAFCEKHGLLFDYINQNAQPLIDKWKTDCRKLGADYYVDDKAIDCEKFLKFF